MEGESVMDNRLFEQRRKEILKEQQLEDEQKKADVKAGRLPSCPMCGSHRYVEATKSEECKDCGHSQGYW